VSLTVLFAGGELRAEAPPVVALRPSPRAGIVRPIPAGPGGQIATQSLPADRIAPAVCCGNLTYHGDFPYDGDAVQHAQKIYTIFWAPPGTSFPSGYQSTINQFVRDLSGTSYYAIASQYYDDAGNIGTTVTLAGSWLDTTSTMGSSISGQDILDEVTRAQSANGWTNDANSYFQVYTPSNVTNTEYCGWHDYEFNVFSPNRAYGLILYPRQVSATATCLQPSPWPNGDVVDGAINVSAHEIMETVTDPYDDGWFYIDGTGEIGDLCNKVWGSRDRNLGSNVLLNGHPYLIQEEWSNAASGCTVTYGTAPFITSISPSPVTGSASAQTITINGTNFINKPWVTVTWSAGAKVLTSSEVTYVSSTQVKMTITTSTAADSWTVKVTNPNGASSNIFSFNVTGGSTGSAPAVSTGSASSITQTSALVSGTVNPNGASTTLYFDYGTTTSYGSTATYGSVGSGTSSVTQSFNLTNLACGTTYQYRARAQNGSGTTNGTNQSFTTSSCSQPSTTELIANGSFASGSTSWVLGGSFYADSRFTSCRSCPGYAYLANSDGSAGDNLVGSMYQTVTIPANATSATLSFWYNITTQETTTSTAYDVLNVTAQNSSGNFLGTIAVLSNLNKTSGYVQASANLLGYAGSTIRINFLGTTDVSLPTVFRVDDVSLLVTAGSPAPSVTTGSASSVDQTSAVLGATVNPNGSNTTLYFDYGPTTSYGSIATYGNAGSGTSSVSVSEAVAGLGCGTTYQYRARAQNGGGTTNGANQSFTTAACSATPPTISVATSLTFNATQGGGNPPGQPVTISNIGGGTLNWTASAGAAWINLSSTSGTAPSTLTISMNISGLSAGSYAAFVTISAAGATNTPTRITVTLNVSPPPAATVTRNDFNGDNKSDLMWRNTVTGDNYIWWMNGNTINGGGFLANLPAPQWSVLGTGDFSGDKKADVLLRDNATGNIWIWLISGSTIAGGGYVANLPPQLVLAGIGDFNGDGKADILWRNTATGDIWVWVMNGNAINGGGYVANLPPALIPAGVGDFNGDSKADVLWRNTVTGDIWIWLMNGNAIAGGGYVANLPASLTCAGVGDFNGDQKADILWRNTSTGDFYVWLMNANAINGGGYLANLPGVWTAASVGDFNGDGKADLVMRNTSTGDNYVWLMNGSTIAGGGFVATLPSPAWILVSP
jgi:hypothetical protein